MLMLDNNQDLSSPPPRQSTVYNMTWRLPITLPLNEIKSLTPFDEVIDKAHYVFAKAISRNNWRSLNQSIFFSLKAKVKNTFCFSPAQCSSVLNDVTTFNNRTYTSQMPLSCYQVLAQDCTDELKFMVLLMKDSVEQSHINVKIADM